MSPQCSLCAGDAGGDAALVCAACQRRHLGAMPVRTTSEFLVPPLPADLAASGSMPSVASDSCTWCGKGAASVKKLLGNGTVAICDECVALCADVMDAELGPAWRG